MTARQLQIEAAEPPILRVLDAMCHNELLTALGGDEGQRASITRLQRWLASWADFRADRLRKQYLQSRAGPNPRQHTHLAVQAEPRTRPGTGAYRPSTITRIAAMRSSRTCSSG